jgi:hypothetical protein
VYSFLYPRLAFNVSCLVPLLSIRRYLAFRLGEAIFLAFLPLLAKAEPHLFYSRSTCLGFAFFLTGHTAILLLAQALVSLRQHIQTEGMSLGTACCLASNVIS